MSPSSGAAPVRRSIVTLPFHQSQLLPEPGKTSESDLFRQQVQEVRDWWASPRYEGIRRPYAAEEIVSKRGSLQQSYPSSLMARKLFALLKERGAKGEPVHTCASRQRKKNKK
jgi:isocitrate lyase